MCVYPTHAHTHIQTDTHDGIAFKTVREMHINSLCRPLCFANGLTTDTWTGYPREAATNVIIIATWTYYGGNHEICFGRFSALGKLMFGGRLIQLTPCPLAASNKLSLSASLPPPPSHRAATYIHSDRPRHWNIHRHQNIDI